MKELSKLCVLIVIIYALISIISFEIIKPDCQYPGCSSRLGIGDWGDKYCIHHLFIGNSPRD